MTQPMDELNYATWPASTNITMCNVPWNSDYRDIVRFADENALANYIGGLGGPTIRISQLSYAKFGQPIRLNVPFNVAQQYNYLRVFNQAQPIPGDIPRAFYYFISDVVFVAPSVTHVYVQLDVWQTFGYSTVFGNCYIDRGHIGIANSRGFNNYGRDFLTVPEGMDIGGEYQIADVKSKAITHVNGGDLSGSVGYRVLVISTTDLEKDPGTVKAPLLNTATGSSMQDLPNGASIYLFNAGSEIQRFLKKFAHAPWMLQGIMSIQAVPRAYNIKTTPATNGDFTGFGRVVEGQIPKVSTPIYQNWRENVLVKNIPLRYRGLRKLLTFPYCVLELTSYTGTPLVLKPESWNDLNATVQEVPHLAPPNARVAFYPFRYNANASSEIKENANGIFNDGGEFLDMTTGINNFPTFSTVNNSYAGFLASNANSIAYQHSSADWSQQKALSGNDLAQQQSNMSIQTSRDLTGIGINAAQQQTALQNQTMGQQAMLNAGAGIVGGIAGGPAGIGAGVAKAALTGVNTAISQNQNTQAMNIGTGAQRASNDRSNQNAGALADTNRQYGDYAARGDYANQIAGINAKVQDAKMVQPTTSGQMGGESFLLSNYQWGYDLKIKTITGAALSSLGEYWLRYGYAVSRFGRMPSNFQVMTNFTYWKLNETYIISSKCPEPMKQAIRGIFEKGVTVWGNPANIGNIDIADNTPLDGIMM